MAPNSSFALHDRILRGRLEGLIREMREDEGLSFSKIAKRLEKKGVDVDPRTVSRWYEAFPQPQDAA